MNTEDRELLELAAKAAGLEGFEWVSDPFFEGLERRSFEGDGSELQSQTWNPLVNGGDAFRLMVGLYLLDAGRMLEFRLEETGINPARSDGEILRRAIVRAAAEIGRRMA